MSKKPFKKLKSINNVITLQEALQHLQNRSNKFKRAHTGSSAWQHVGSGLVGYLRPRGTLPGKSQT